jgi:hypothetical protein
MDQYDELIKTIEGEDLTREVLKYSKLRKGESTGHVELLCFRTRKLTSVMEEMAKIEGIPRNDELNITQRANALFVKWGNVGNKTEEPKTNGAEPDAKSDSKEKTEDKAEDKAAEEKSAEEKAEAPATEAAAETTEAAA